MGPGAAGWGGQAAGVRGRAAGRGWDLGAPVEGEVAIRSGRGRGRGRLRSRSGSAPVEGVIRFRPGTQAPPTHLPEPTYPCCLPALGEFSQIAPREGLRPEYPMPNPPKPRPPSLRRTGSGRRVGRAAGTGRGTGPPGMGMGVVTGWAAERERAAAMGGPLLRAGRGEGRRGDAAGDRERSEGDRVRGREGSHGPRAAGGGRRARTAAHGRRKAHESCCRRRRKAREGPPHGPHQDRVREHPLRSCNVRGGGFA